LKAPATSNAGVALLDARSSTCVSVFIAVKTNQHNAEWVQRFRKIVVSFPEVVDFLPAERRCRLSDPCVVSDIRAYDDLYQRLIAKIDLHDVSSMIHHGTDQIDNRVAVGQCSIRSGRHEAQTARNSLVTSRTTAPRARLPERARDASGLMARCPRDMAFRPCPNSTGRRVAKESIACREFDRTPALRLTL